VGNAANDHINHLQDVALLRVGLFDSDNPVLHAIPAIGDKVYCSVIFAQVLAVVPVVRVDENIALSFVI
jgi:hypothetical protein